MAAMELKTQKPQKAHLGLLMNVHTKFQLLSSIWSGNREGIALFQGQTGEPPPHITPFNLLERFIFGYVIQLLILYQLV